MAKIPSRALRKALQEALERRLVGGTPEALARGGSGDLMEGARMRGAAPPSQQEKLPADPFAQFPPLPVATTPPPGMSADDALETARSWVESLGGGPEGEQRALGIIGDRLRELPDDSAHVSVPVMRRDLQRQLDAVTSGAYRQGARSIWSARVEEAFPELYGGTQQPLVGDSSDLLAGVGVLGAGIGGAMTLREALAQRLQDRMAA